jgi:hypothetical protein
MFIDSIPKELTEARWTEVSNPCLELDKGPDASYQMVPMIGINTLLILNYRWVKVKGELFIEIENYEGTRSASKFAIANIKSTEAHGSIMAGYVRFEFKDGTAHQFNFTDKSCAEDFLQNINNMLIKGE